MAVSPRLAFADFRLDPDTGTLVRGGAALHLAPKAFGVLRCLVERSGEVVSRAELLREVWPDAHVTPAVLKVAILEIRRALGDDAARPRFIETVPRRGYRFVGATGGIAPPSHDRAFVGRSDALDRLGEHLGRAGAGRVQVVFVAGEAGIGKTALLETFVARLGAGRDVDVAWGACLEHHGVAETYLPVLDALGRLCRGPGRGRIADVLATHAPTWLASLPAALAGREVSVREVLGVTPQRMLREMADALFVLSETRPLVLVLEDLHWSDYSTLDLIAMLARRSDPARLLVLGSYRPMDAARREHPLRGVVRDLRARAACDEIVLDDLAVSEVSEYLGARFPGHAFPDPLADVVHRRTDGNALFLVRLTDELVANGALLDDGGRWRLVRSLDDVGRLVPATLGELIEQQVLRLEPERRRLLETASLLGREFAADAVAAGMDGEPESTEEHCDELVRQGSLLASAETGTTAGETPLARYRFTHALYPEVLAARMPAARRMRTHARIARWLTSAPAGDGDSVAAALAYHRERSHDWPGAIESLRRAADEEMRRGASQEAIERLRHAREIASRLTPRARDAAWPELQDHLARAYRAAGEHAEAADGFRELAAWARARGDVSWRARAALSLASVLSWEDSAASRASSEEGLALAARLEDPVLRAHLGSYAAYWRLHLEGWRAEDARLAHEAVRVIRESGDHRFLSHALLRLALFEGTCGRLGAAASVAREGIDVALAAGDAYECMGCHAVLGGALRRLGAFGDALLALDEGGRIAERSGHHLFAVMMGMLRAMLHRDALDFSGAAEIARATLEEARIPYLASDAASVLAGALARLGRVEEAERVLASTPADLGDDFAMRGAGRPWRLEALATVALARGDARAADRHAEDLAARAHQLGDPVSSAIAAWLRAEAALALARAPDALTRAADGFAALTGLDCPIAEWPLHDVAARAHRAARDPVRAKAARARAGRVVDRVAASLAHAEVARAEVLRASLRAWGAS